MRRSLRPLIAAAALVIAACSDNQLAPDGATPRASETLPPRFSLIPPPEVCPSVDESQATVDALLPQLFGPGQGRRGKAQDYTNDIVQARRRGDRELELVHVDSLMNFTLQNYYAGTLIGGQTEETQNRVLSFLYALHCASGIEPIPDLSNIFLAANTQFIRNSTPTTTVTAGSAATLIEQGDVPADIFGTFVSIVRTNDPLPTSLDWYGVDGYRQGAFEFIANPPVTFTTPVLTGVCIEFDDEIVSAADLRLAHGVAAGSTTDIPGNAIVTTPGGTIEVMAYADPGPLDLDCDPLPPPSASRLGRILDQFASFFVPALLNAAELGGSTGGTVRKFSPFGAVDTKLNGTAANPSSPQLIPIGSTSVDAAAGVTVTTRNDQSPVGGLGVAFAPAGSFAPDSAVTNASGVASATWTLVEGSNTGAATLAAPLSFAAPVNFAVTLVQLTTLSITTTSLPAGTQSAPYGPATLTAAGGAGAGSYSWSLATGSTLPNGLSLSTGGVLSGTPTVNGQFTFTVRVTSGPLADEKTFTISILIPTAFGPLTFDPAPSARQCYAINTVIAPAVAVKVTSTSGHPVAGVRVDLAAVNNNGAKVETTQPFAITGADGRAVFNALAINKTGSYRLIASTSAPFPMASVQSGKFTISPAC